MPADNPYILKDVNDKLPEKIYHYTSQQGLFGILESQSLWATHYKCLNDSTELIYAKAFIKKKLKPIFKTIITKLCKKNKDIEKRVRYAGSISFSVDLFTSLYADKMLHVFADLSYGTFITSFCGAQDKNGLLSMWRAYGEYAIQFNSDILWDCIKEENGMYVYSEAIFKKVIYSNEVKKLNNEFNFQKFTSIFETRIKKSLLGDHSLMSFYEYGVVSRTLLECMSRYKHEGFHEEKEVRFVFQPQSEEHRNMDTALPYSTTEELNEIIKDRVIKDKKKTKPLVSEPKSHIELFNFKHEDSSYKLPISRIIVGPGKNQSSNLKSIENFLAEHNLSIDIHCSEIPYI